MRSLPKLRSRDADPVEGREVGAREIVGTFDGLAGGSRAAAGNQMTDSKTSPLLSVGVRRAEQWGKGTGRRGHGSKG